MSDFLSELRHEVVGAHAAHRRRSRPRRLARALWRPGPLLGAAAAAAALLALIVGVRSVRAPDPAGGPRVLDVVNVGGNPVDGTFHDGSLWVADFRGRAAVRLDPARRRVTARIAIGGKPSAIAAGPAGLWVRTWQPDGGRRTDVSRIEPSAKRIVGRATTGFGTAIAVGLDAVWAAVTEIPPEGLDRIDARTAERTRLVRVPHVYGLAADDGAVWALMGDGTVVQVDAVTARVSRRWPRLAVSNPGVENENSLVAADGGAWVLGSGMGVEAMLVRIEDGEVTRRLPVHPQSLPAITAAFGDLWIASQPEPSGPYRVSRLDPTTGATTGTVAIGAHRPAALVPAGDTLCVVSTDGAVILVDPGGN